MTARRRLVRTPLADAVGVLLAGDLAPRLLDNFDFYGLALASRVSRRWRTAAVRSSSAYGAAPSVPPPHMSFVNA